MTKWFSVADDPPPEDGIVALGHRPHGHISEAYQIVWFDDEGDGWWGYIKQPEDGFDLPITHWMPIPPPPRVTR